MSQNYDIVVGIPTYNEAPTIGSVTQIVGAGLLRHFPNERSIIVNCDNSSPDGTQEAFLAAESKVDRHCLTTPPGVTGKGNNLLNLFRYSLEVGARAIIAVDGDLRSITPEWIEYLAFPILEGYDYVTPVYSRNQFDGAITNHICFPLLMGLTGNDIRQPTGGEFACSRDLCRHWMEQDWSDDARHYGADIFLSLHALNSSFKVCQAGLGAKIHKASTPKLGCMFDEIVHTLFSTLVKMKATWYDGWRPTGDDPLGQGRIRSTDVTGEKKLQQPQWLDVNILKLKSDCRREFHAHQNLVQRFLSPYAYRQISNMVSMDYYNIDLMLWSQIVYSALYLYETVEESARQDVINFLKPIYLMRSLAFNYKSWRYDILFSEEEVKNQALGFMAQKPYLFGLYLGADATAEINRQV